jgi:adenylate cyclase, class 2
MSIEIELKLRVESHGAVREKLLAVGAERVGAVVETNHILDRPDGALRGQGFGLRVRVAEDQGTGESTTTFTFKGPRTPGVIKSREEIETLVSDSASFLKILARLGYVSILEYQKRRESWLLDGCRVELDEPTILGFFVEIEGDGEESIRNVQRKLALGETAEEGRSYVSTLISHCKDAGIADRVLRFDSE